jgi:hypothetical protein
MSFSDHNLRWLSLACWYHFFLEHYFLLKRRFSLCLNSFQRSNSRDGPSARSRLLSSSWYWTLWTLSWFFLGWLACSRRIAFLVHLLLRLSMREVWFFSTNWFEGYCCWPSHCSVVERLVNRVRVGITFGICFYKCRIEFYFWKEYKQRENLRFKRK